MSANDPFVVYEGRIVGVVAPTRVYLAVEHLDAAAARFVAVMCLCNREIVEGRMSGPFTSELAARWARLVLIGPQHFVDGISDKELADRLHVPHDQVVLARAELDGDPADPAYEPARG